MTEMSSNHSIWLLLVFATFGLSQDVYKSNVGNLEDAKEPTKNDSNVFSLLVSSNISVIINDNLRKSQLGARFNPDAFRDSATEASNKEVETVTTIVVGNIEEYRPSIGKRVISGKVVDAKENMNKEDEEVNASEVGEEKGVIDYDKNDESNDSNEYKDESKAEVTTEASFETKPNVTENEEYQIDSSPDEEIPITTTIISKTEDVEEEMGTEIDNQPSTTSVKPEDSSVWDEEVTQYNDDYKTSIIFTNLFGPADDTTEIIKTIIEEKNNVTNDEGLNDNRTKKEIKDDEGSSDKLDMKELEDNSDKDQDINATKEVSDKNIIETTTSINTQDETAVTEVNNDEAINISNTVRNQFTNSLSDIISNGKRRNDGNENSTSDKDNTETESTLPSVISRIPPRKDIRTLIEEKRKKRPSFRLNQTRFNREQARTTNKVLEKVLSNNVIAADKRNVNFYLLEENTRKSWGGCARECGTRTMTCRYELTLEWFHSVSKACYSCPDNLEDCFRPHCISTDGVKRTIAVINRSLPGPLIQVCEGDTIIAKVTNMMMESTTSIHWHGQHQLLSPYMDGVPSVTQCPIQPGASFTYAFTAANPGTHFYHSHSGVQRGDGAFGGLIVRRSPAKERHSWTYDHDLPQHTIMILDWTHHLGLQTFTHHHHAGGGNKPDTLLVNGRGIVGNYSMPPASFTVTKGQRYRFRLINAGVLNCPIRMSVDDHVLKIIASDGNDIQPFTVDWLVTYAGERWDFVIEANADISNYWMRFIGLMDCDERFTSAHQGAVLHYTGATITLPDSALSYNYSSLPRIERQPKILNALNAGLSDGTILVHQLSGLARPQSWLATKQPDRKIVLAYDFNPLDNELFHKPTMYGFSQVIDMKSKIYTPQLNHISMKLPPFPLLTESDKLTDKMLCTNMDQKKCKQDHCECTNIINIALGDIVEIIFIDQGFVYDANHPFHLHGHSFYVVGMDRLGSNVTSERVLDLDSKGLIDRNLATPPLKDTVTVPDGGYTIIRFLANNPGYWLLHCHIDFHVEVGMAVVLKVGDESDFVSPPPGFPTCGDFDPTMNKTQSLQIDENRVDNRVIGFVDAMVNPSFGSRWKYNTSSSYSHRSSCLYTAICVLVAFLVYC